MPVTYTFASASAPIPLSQLDSNFATPITLGNTAIQLGNTVTTLNNMTLANVTVTSGNIANVTLSNVTISGSSTNVSNATGILAEANGGTGTTTGYYGFKNRIINGAMIIDQRNAGAATANTINGYTIDRWYVGQTVTGKLIAQQNAGSVTPPSGFAKYLGVTSQSAYSILSSDQYYIDQAIEGLNAADLNWGTANAVTVTLSFWVRSSLTGTFGGAIANYAATRSYPFTYTINSANTWEQKSVTIPGDTSGTWLTTNSGFGYIFWGLGVGATYSGAANSWANAFYASATGATSVVGTNGATFYITGVQLEKGSTATSFDYRPYGTELALCQRYYYRVTAQIAGDYTIATATTAISTTQTFTMTNFPVSMRTKPTALEQSGTASDYVVVRCGSATFTNCSAVPSFSQAGLTSAMSIFTVASGLTNGAAGLVYGNTTSAYLGWSAEL